MAKPDDAGRVIAGLLTYNPGPGIYSRLERAIQAMPENVRTQELPGLLKRYKDGVPGWELKAVDLDSVIGQRPAVSREELLQAVKERSPVYTHKEVVLGGNPPKITEEPSYESPDNYSLERKSFPVHEDNPSSLGSGAVHGQPQYQNYGQGGKDYTEVLLVQPGADEFWFNNHWGGRSRRGEEAVAHARFDTHGDALRINELQSDLGIHNRQVRGRAGTPPPAQHRDHTDGTYYDMLQEMGYKFDVDDYGAPINITGPHPNTFPLEDAWSDLLIKRLALEAARQGHRAIEVASPSSVFAKTGNRGDEAASMARMEHFYGKVVPGAVERLGKRMGGLTEEPVEQLGPVIRYELPFNNGSGVTEPRGAAEKIFRKEFPQSGPLPAFDLDPSLAYDKLEWAYSKKPESVGEYATLLQAALANRLKSGGMDIGEAERAAGMRMPEIIRLAEEQAMRADAFDRVQNLRDVQEMTPGHSPYRTEAGRRYIMSDEMRRRLIEGGVGAAVATGIMSQDDLINRLNQ